MESRRFVKRTTIFFSKKKKKKKKINANPREQKGGGKKRKKKNQDAARTRDQKVKEKPSCAAARSTSECNAIHSKRKGK